MIDAEKINKNLDFLFDKYLPNFGSDSPRLYVSIKNNEIRIVHCTQNYEWYECIIPIKINSYINYEGIIYHKIFQLFTSIYYINSDRYLDAYISRNNNEKLPEGWKEM